MRLSRNLMGVGDLVPSQPGLPFWPSGSGMGDLVGSHPGLPFWPSAGGMGSLGFPFPAANLPQICGAPPLPSCTPGTVWPSCGGPNQFPCSVNTPAEQNQFYFMMYGPPPQYADYDESNVSSLRGVGDLLPSNPGLPFWPSSGGMGSCGGDCGCGGKCGGCGGGMGAISDDLSGMVSNLTSGQFSAAWGNFTSAMTEPIFGTVPLWVVAGGAALAYVFFFSGGAKHSRYQRGRRALASARGAYA